MAIYSLSHNGLEAKFNNTETNLIVNSTDAAGKIADVITGTTFLGIGKYAVAGYLGMIFINNKQAIKNANKGKGVIITVPWWSFSTGGMFGLKITSRT